MYEQQLISYILKNNDLDILKQNQLTKEHFLTCSHIIEFIEDYELRYQTLPSEETVIQHDPNFQPIEVEDSIDYISNQIRETYLYSQLAPVLKESAEKTKVNSLDAIKYLKEHIDRLSLEANDKAGVGVDITARAGERYRDYLDRKQRGGLLGISSGIKQLDEILFGWAEEDLITIVARPGEGKSWMLQYFAVQAWRNGKKVLYYSGEMSETIIGYRFDTLNANFTNSGLMSGDIRSMEEEQRYMDYIDNLSKQEGFITLTPENLKGKRPTTQDIIELTEYHKPDIIVLDYIALLDDWKRAKDKRDRLGNISADLQNYSATAGIPILTAAQANREAAKKNEDKDNPEAPSAHEISDSDQVLQNSTRVIGLARVDNILKLAIRKNRYGISEGEVLMHWDIDKGILKPLLDDDKIENNEYGF